MRIAYFTYWGAIGDRVLEWMVNNTDDEIVASAGKDIPSIFVEDGEPAFRELERAAVAASLENHDGVLALGGGAILDPETQRVLGVGLVGPGAGELIAEGVLAVEMAALAADVKLSIHPHPTLSETIMEAAEVFFGQSTHVHRPRRRSVSPEKAD